MSLSMVQLIPHSFETMSSLPQSRPGVQYKFKHKFAVVDLQIFDLPDTEELQNAWVTFSNTGTKQVRVAVCSFSRALSFTFAKITSGLTAYAFLPISISIECFFAALYRVCRVGCSQARVARLASACSRRATRGDALVVWQNGWCRPIDDECRCILGFDSSSSDNSIALFRGCV
jgi:hypothetical protein